MQRLTYYFANGLEARLVGYGTEIYNALIASWPVTEVLKYYHLFLAIFPFRKAANYFSNETIVNLAEKSDKVHIVDFENCNGFQWPSLMQRLSYRAMGPPELWLTAIDFPQPGFCPVERPEASGHLLVSYAEAFKVPFKYDAIAAKWDEVKIENIQIKTDEVTFVNCIIRLEDLLYESVVEESPRDTFLNLIRKINPQVFIQEGLERIGRPETYKKWHLRNVRAGLVPLPLDREIFNSAKDKIARCYHKDFEMEEDGEWQLHGWKGRIMHAL